MDELFFIIIITIYLVVVDGFVSPSCLDQQFVGQHAVLGAVPEVVARDPARFPVTVERLLQTYATHRMTSANKHTHMHMMRHRNRVSNSSHTHSSRSDGVCFHCFHFIFMLLRTLEDHRIIIQAARDTMGHKITPPRQAKTHQCHSHDSSQACTSDKWIYWMYCET